MQYPNDDGQGYITTNERGGLFPNESKIGKALGPILDKTGENIDTFAEERDSVLSCWAWELKDGRVRLVAFCNREQLLEIVVALVNRVRALDGSMVADRLGPRSGKGLSRERAAAHLIEIEAALGLMK